MSRKLYHAYQSAVSDGSNTQLVRPSNWNAALQYGTAGAPSGTDAEVIESLSTARNYYVRTDGNDSNDGLTNNSGGAFLTIQKAVDVVSTLNMNGFDVTINVADGTYTLSTVITLKGYTGDTAATSGPAILGNNSTPSNVLLTSSTVGIFYSESEKPWGIGGMKMTTTAGGSTALVYAARGIINLGANEYGAAPRQLFATYGGQVYQIGLCTISGGSTAFATVAFGATVGIYPSTVTLTGTPAFSTAFAYALANGTIEFGVATFSGSATGTRYFADSNGVINTYGAGATYLPGNVAGATANGGQYV